MPFFKRDRASPEAREEAERVAAALDGGPLGGRDVDVLPIPRSDAVAFAIVIDPDELREAWGAARAPAGELGRYPVAVTAWDGELKPKELFGLFGGDETPPEQVLARGRELSFEDGLAHFRGEDDDDEDDDGEDDDGDHLEWYEPRGQPVALLLLPVGASEDVAAYVPFYGAWDAPGHAALVAVLRGWRERWGAELVAAWGTMLQLAVERPPQDRDAALELAGQQRIVAPDTLRLPGVSRRAHAEALAGREEWFLHERP